MALKVENMIGNRLRWTGHIFRLEDTVEVRFVEKCMLIHGWE